MRHILREEMTEPFVETETGRTKSRWVARAFREMGRRRTTIAALFYHALQREEPDYPICGGFVGEIRATRAFQEGDRDRLYKWARTAVAIGYLPEDSFLEDLPGVQTILPKVTSHLRPYRLEVWISRSAFNPLLEPVCSRHGAVLVSISGRLPSDAIDSLYQRSGEKDTVLLCLADLSPEGTSFVLDLARALSDLKRHGVSRIRMRQAALTPEQVVRLKIPMVALRGGQSRGLDRYRRHLKPFGLDPRRMAELDALEALCTGGIARFMEDELSRYTPAIDLDREDWLMDLRRGMLPPV